MVHRRTDLIVFLATFGLCVVLGCGEDSPIRSEDPDDDPSAIEYAVTFALAPTNGPLGALQFDVAYFGSSGGWVGAGGGAQCRWLVAAALHACNDKRGGRLTCAVVDTDGFSGPAPLVECSFKSRDSVEAADFDVDVVDASTPWLEPIDARVYVSGAYER